MLSSLIGALIGGGAALLGSFLAYRYQSRLERLRAGREKLAPVYEDLIRIVQDASSVPKAGTREYRDNVTKMQTFRRTLCIWGSTDIVKAYDTWGRMANSLNPAAPVENSELMSKRVLAQLLGDHQARHGTHARRGCFGSARALVRQRRVRRHVLGRLNPRAQTASRSDRESSLFVAPS